MKDTAGILSVPLCITNKQSFVIFVNISKSELRYKYKGTFVVQCLCTTKNTKNI